jgi:hypothetical protein
MIDGGISNDYRLIIGYNVKMYFNWLTFPMDYFPLIEPPNHVNFRNQKN